MTGFQQPGPIRPVWPTQKPAAQAAGRRFHAYTAKHLDELTARAGLSAVQRLAVRAVATVLPFRTNAYVVDHLIDWHAAPADPMYRLVFPQADMLPEADVSRIAVLLARDAPAAEVHAAAHEVRMRLNPHPAGQLALNTPALDDEPLPGLQHKYPETVLLIPNQGQTSQADCTYCFRWAQFVDEPDLKMAMGDSSMLVSYLLGHPEVTGVLITGGDPMIMGAPVLRRYIEPLLDPRLDSLESIRIGSKSLRLLARSGSSPTRTPTRRCACSRTWWRPAGAWPSWRISRIHENSSPRSSPRRCAGSCPPGRSSAPRRR